MGFMSNHYRIEHDGHTIEVEATSSFYGKTTYSLFIDDERVDRTEATLGRFTLRGRTNTKVPGSQRPFVIRIKAGVFSDDCTLEIAGESTKLSKT